MTMSRVSESCLPKAYHARHLRHGPHRLVVRTSRCGRDNPGSTPGVDILLERLHTCCGTAVLWSSKPCKLVDGRRESCAHKAVARQLAICIATKDMASRTLWPSGLRRWLKAPFRKGVGSNPTGVTFPTPPPQFSPRNVDRHRGKTPYTIASLAQLVRA